MVSPLGGTCPALVRSPAGTRTVRQSGTSPHSHVVNSNSNTHSRRLTRTGTHSNITRANYATVSWLSATSPGIKAKLKYLLYPERTRDSLFVRDMRSGAPSTLEFCAALASRRRYRTTPTPNRRTAASIHGGRFFFWPKTHKKSFKSVFVTVIAL